MKWTLEEIAELVNGEIEGDKTTKISEIHGLEHAAGGSISFFTNPKYESKLYETDASAVIVGKDFKPKKAIHFAVIRAEDPYVAVSILLNEFQRMASLDLTGIESPVHKGKNCEYGKEIYLGAFAYLGDRVKLGHGVKIHPHSYVGDDAMIGDHTILYPGVKIYPGTKVGSYCTIHAGAVIGSHGFGYAPQSDGTYQSIPQVGKVILEDHVDIGANTTIDCGTMDPTIIHRGVKIDNLVQVGHNVEIDENTVIAAQTGISGSARIGKNVVMGGQVGVQGHIQVANKTTVAAKAGVTRTVRKEGQTISGKFAYNNADYLKSYALFRKLPDLMKRIENLEQKHLNLRSGKEANED